MIFIAGSAISFFLTILVFLKKRKSKADRILLVWFAVNSVHQLLFYFDISGFAYKHAYLLALNTPFPFLHCPLYFLYVSAYVHRLPKRTFIFALHFLPFVVSYLFFLQFYLLPAEQKVSQQLNNFPDFTNLIQGNYYSVLASGIIYLLLSFLFLRKYHREINERYSTIDKAHFRWLQLLGVGLVLVWIVVYFGSVTQIFVVVGMNTMITGIYGIRQTLIFSDSGALIPEESRKAAEIKSQQIRYEKSGLTSEMKKQISAGLQTLMAEKKIFTNSNLSLDTLASSLGTHPNYLSQYINEELKLTFFDYINRLRVDEFKRIAQLPSHKNFNVLALAYECGFSSKSSFNRIFKKTTGETPSEYMQGIRKVS